MTVTYYPKVATIKFTVTLRLLARWKGSLYKLVLPDIAMFILLYTTLSLLYRFALTEAQRTVFQIICRYAREYSGTTTVTFCLGFYTAYVLGRWWETFKNLPFMFTPGYHIRQIIVPPCVTQSQVPMSASGDRGPDILTVSTKGIRACDVTEMKASVIRAQYEEALEIRLNLIRYMLLSWIWMLRRMSTPLLVRFKPHEKLSDSTLLDKLRVMNCDPHIQKFFPRMLTDAEIDAIVAYAKRVCGDDYDKYEPDHFIPSGWAADLIHEARARGYIANDYLVRDLLQTVRDFRGNLGFLKLMDMFNVPLVYTQVVSLCLYIYTLLNCFATQFTDANKPDVYVPLPFILQLAFLFGWLRVSEVCLNPFGEDDDDFNTWQILNMNLETAYKMAVVFDRDLIKEAFASPTVAMETKVNGTGAVRKHSIITMNRKRRKSTQSALSSVNEVLRLPSDLTLNGGQDTSEFNLPKAGASPENLYRKRLYSVAQEPEETSLLQGQSQSQNQRAEENERDASQLDGTEYYRENYEKFRQMYDKPAHEGSALENELGNSRKMSTGFAPNRAQSRINLSVSKLLGGMMQVPQENFSLSRSNLAAAANNGSRQNVITGSRLAVSASRTNIDQQDAQSASNASDNEV